MRKILLAGTGLMLLAGGGVALAQMPPGGPGGRGGPDDMEAHGRMEMHHHMRMRPGAAFRFRRGDAEIDVRCAVREPMQACVAAASALLDKVSSLPSKTP
jgi:hypothetical protein